LLHPCAHANKIQFNAAIGLFIPPAFKNIKYGLFLLFFTYPETCGKTIEEIEVLFSHEGPRAWQTRKGSERLEHDVNDVADSQAKKASVAHAEKAEV
jgi:hypothetical protein